MATPVQVRMGATVWLCFVPPGSCAGDLVLVVTILKDGEISKEEEFQ